MGIFSKPEIIIFKESNSAEAVSYTHLDVYKRQEKCSEVKEQGEADTP